MASGCSYIFGIPIHETPECRRRRKAQKYDYKEEKQDTRQNAHTDRVDIKNAQQAAKNIADANAGLEPGNDALQTITDTLPLITQVITDSLNPVSGLLGGLSGGSATSAEPLPGPDLAPLAIGAAVVGIAILIWSR